MHLEGIYFEACNLALYNAKQTFFMSLLLEVILTPHIGGRNASKVAEMSFQSTLSLADKRRCVVICVYKGKKLYLMLLLYLCSQLKCYTTD